MSGHRLVRPAHFPERRVEVANGVALAMRSPISPVDRRRVPAHGDRLAATTGQPGTTQP